MPVNPHHLFSTSIGLFAALAITPALAFETQAHGIKISGLTRHFGGTDSLSNVSGPEDYESASNATTDDLQFFQNGSVMSWRALSGLNCQGSEGYTTVAIIYHVPGAKSGSLSCRPSQSGGATDLMSSTGHVTYHSNARTVGDTLMLSGTLTKVQDRTFTAGGTRTGSYHVVESVKQSLTLQINGSDCRVLSYSNQLSSRSTGGGRIDTGQAWSSRHDTHAFNTPAGDVSCGLY